MKYRQFLALMLVISIASCSAHTYNRTAYAMTETETNGSAAEVIVDDSSDKEISGVDVEYDGKDNYKEITGIQIATTDPVTVDGDVFVTINEAGVEVNGIEATVINDAESAVTIKGDLKVESKDAAAVGISMGEYSDKGNITVDGDVEVKAVSSKDYEPTPDNKFGQCYAKGLIGNNIDVSGDVNVYGSGGATAVEGRNVNIGGNLTADSDQPEAYMQFAHRAIWAETASVGGNINGNVEVNSIDAGGDINGLLHLHSYQSTPLSSHIGGNVNGSVEVAFGNINLTIDGDVIGTDDKYDPVSQMGGALAVTTGTVLTNSPEINVHIKGDTVGSVSLADWMSNGDSTIQIDGILDGPIYIDDANTTLGTSKSLGKSTLEVDEIQLDDKYIYVETYPEDVEDLSLHFAINTWKITTDNGTANIFKTDPAQNFTQAELKAIKNIVNYTIKITDFDNWTAESSAASAHEGDTIQITVIAAEGYEVDTISSGTEAVMTSLGNGKYQLIVPAGGGINIQTVMKAIEKAVEDTEGTPENSGIGANTSEEAQPSDSGKNGNNGNGNNNGKGRGNGKGNNSENGNNGNGNNGSRGNSGSGDKDSDGSGNSGNSGNNGWHYGWYNSNNPHWYDAFTSDPHWAWNPVPVYSNAVTDRFNNTAFGISFQSALISDSDIEDSVISSLAIIPDGQTLKIETSKNIPFSRRMIQALAGRRDIDVELIFSINGRRYCVIIPKGYNVMNLLTKAGQADFFQMASVLGYEETD